MIASNDNNTSINDIKNKIKDFCDARDWDQFHNAKDLAIGLVIEASELLEHFRFKSEEEIEDKFNDLNERKKITEELADVLYFTVLLANKYNVDLTTELNDKIKKNEQKYPIEKAKGSNKKYTEL